MRFESLSIENLRGVRKLVLSDLRELVVLAGPNGCGKSTALDAIRLLKSFYGGYQSNEWQQWMGEFNVKLNSSESMATLLADPGRDLVVEATIQISDQEISYVRENAESLLREIHWRDLSSVRKAPGMPRTAEDWLQHNPQLFQTARMEAKNLERELDRTRISAGIRISPNGQVAVTESKLLSVIFQTYAPEALGLIDYHSSSRSYEREAISGINLDVEHLVEQRKGNLLYNLHSKYRNVKAELASHFLRDLVAREAGVDSSSNLNSTLMELFQAFFPNKEYKGPTPRPDGSLAFLVYLSTGEVHDIDELSSGEKEILYGYLRLRNSSPRNSVVLIDEPELHLNPRLLQGLPDFYHRHLGKEFNNQIWLVTHSDTLLRQTVGKADFSVYHVSPVSGIKSGDNQATSIVANDDLENAVTSMVGDLAAYRPNSKVVIFEGGGDSETDVAIVGRLFPDFAQKLNFVSGGHKKRVRDLYNVLSDTAAKAGLKERFFAVVDRDRDTSTLPTETSVLQWDRYHVENFLLDEKAIRAAAYAVTGRDVFTVEDEVTTALRESAERLFDKLVLERLQDEVNNRLVAAISVGASPNTSQPSVDLMPSVANSLQRLALLGDELTGTNFLARSEEQHRSSLLSALASDNWRAEIPGRPILKDFTHRHIGGVSYEVFRNIILDKMVEHGTRPEGLLEVLEQIVAA